MNWRLGLQVGLFIFWLLLLALVAMAVIGWVIPDIRTDVLRFVEDNGGWSVVLPQLLSKRVSHGLTIVFLISGLVLIVGRLFPRIIPRSAADFHNPTSDTEAVEEDRYVVTYTPSTGFALLLIGAGILLTLIPEFVYLRDYFGTRMNTVFKLYYQAWLVLSIAGAYAIYSVLANVRERVPSVAVKGVFAVVVVFAVMLGLLFPVLGIYHRMFIETFRTTSAAQDPLTLDGGTTMIGGGDDYQAIMCLDQLVQGDNVVVAESVGNSYHGENGRTATLTGISVVYNWPFHQQQWRGGTFSEISGSRQEDMDVLYRDPTWNTTQQIIDRYGIDYIFFGTTERNTYGPDAEIKFRDRLEVVCERGDSRYYRVGDVAVAG
jgi:uncharacterized membrane protein